MQMQSLFTQANSRKLIHASLMQKSTTSCFLSQKKTVISKLLLDDQRYSSQSMACQDDVNIALMISIMYIFCHIYLSMGNRMSYNEIHGCAQLYVTILIPHPEFEVSNIYL